MAAEETSNKQRAIAPILRLPSAPGEKAYLVGYRCSACEATYLGADRVGCSKCTATDELKEVQLSDHGTLYVFSIVHQSAPGIPVPYISAIVDLPRKEKNAEGEEESMISLHSFSSRVTIRLRARQYQGGNA